MDLESYGIYQFRNSSSNSYFIKGVFGNYLIGSSDNLLVYENFISSAGGISKIINIDGASASASRFFKKYGCKELVFSDSKVCFPSVHYSEEYLGLDFEFLSTEKFISLFYFYKHRCFCFNNFKFKFDTNLISLDTELTLDELNLLKRSDFMAFTNSKSKRAVFPATPSILESKFKVDFA